VRRSALELQVHEAPGHRVVEVTGEIDIATVSSLDDCLSACTTGFDGTIELDMRGVQFMDTTGVWLLGGTTAASERAPWSLTVLPSGPVMRVLAICGMLERVPVAATAASSR
jgi:anti-anti-sigma factor